VNADDSAEVEERVLHELEGIVRTKDENLSRGSAKIAKELLARLRVPKKEGETEGNYESRIVADGIETLGIKRLAEG
jgi:rRNA-processing protein FCF1